MQQRKSPDDVALVTSAALSHSQDIALRQRRYLITQTVRLCCVVLATLLPVPLVWKGVLIVGAVALPWFGVVAANAGPTVRRRRRRSTLLASSTPVAEPTPAIEASRVLEAER